MSTAVAADTVESLSPVKFSWMVTVVGVISILAGFIALVYPAPTLLAVGLVFGIWMLLWGAFAIMRGLGGRSVVSVIIGVIGLFTGLVLIVRPGQSVLTVVVVMGLWWLLTGILEFLEGVASSENRWANIILGLLGAGAGLAILVWPGIGIITLVYIVSFTLIIRGMLEVALSLQLRTFAKEAS